MEHRWNAEDHPPSEESDRASFSEKQECPAPEKKGEGHANEDAEPLVRLHYPGGIPLSKILPEISGWSGYNFVIAPELDRKIQIVAPRKISPQDAFQIFVASLETTGLRALQIDSTLIKIVRLSSGERIA